jgi:hypothetical protein
LEYQLDGLLTTVRNGLRRVQHSRQQGVAEEAEAVAAAEVPSEPAS